MRIPTFVVGVLAPLTIVSEAVAAPVEVNPLFSDHMVLQQGMPVPVWGTADPGTAVEVVLGAQLKRTLAGDDGRWRVELEPMKASRKPLSMLVGQGSSAVVQFTDVLVGEVWICGGQSNMERQLGPRPPQKPIVNWEEEVAKADHPLIREFHVPQGTSLTPLQSVPGKWTVCSPETVQDFSAVGYFFARDLQKELRIPVGIIHSSYGGTPAQGWMDEKALAPFPEYIAELESSRKAEDDPTGMHKQYLDRLTAWFKDNDPGSGEKPWSSIDLDTGDWQSMDLPVLWESGGFGDVDGVGWFRRTFDLPEGWAGKDIELHLSAIDDIDTTWVNGTEVGSTYLYNTPRVYRVPAAALKPTGNVIAIRVLDTGGGGGIWNSELPLEAVAVDTTTEPLSLAGPWQAKFSKAIADASRPPRAYRLSSQTPTALYNAMLVPIIPYAIRGFTFYQGESNAYDSYEYRSLFPALIDDWRGMWGEGDIPFLFVQIAPFSGEPPEIREAQLLTLGKTENTAMVVTIDCGDPEDIHPAHKQPVGLRLALAARALAYGERRLEYSGPIFQKMSVRGSKATLRFTHVKGGLEAKNGPLTGFTVAGDDGIFHPAQAEIRGKRVVVTSPEVERPTAVRYAWANVASGNLFNGEGLPASPFRTDVTP